MTDNAEKRFTNQNSREEIPFLQIIKVEANTVSEAMEKAGGGAGQAELDWVLANSEEARKMLEGNNYFFFPEAADGDVVPFVHWPVGEFWPHWYHRDCMWSPRHRIVQVG